MVARHPPDREHGARPEVQPEDRRARGLVQLLHRRRHGADGELPARAEPQDAVEVDPVPHALRLDGLDLPRGP